ncbi:CIS tube protein [Pontibacter qinzhouensis]|nr:LysM peptidoglycan-binding domain-containing protein [Pontibacter qinzhouensis]
MEEKGEVKKMWIRAYRSATMEDKDFVGEYYAMVNPETYAIDLKMEVKEGQGQGTSGKQQKFTFKKPEELSFEFLFDNTGIIDGKPKPKGIHEDLQKLQDLAFKLDGEVHEPHHVLLIWGKLVFQGRITGMTINYKLFNPDGTPIRAMVKITIKQSEEESERTAKERKSSPDLTHIRTIRKGESLPWLCYLIYGSPKYYLEVARANKLSNFRKIKEGTQILFPPFQKT